MTTTSTKDIIELIDQDHNAAKALLKKFEGLSPDERDPYFCEVVSELVQHEVAEQQVVYPVIRREAPDGDNEVAPRLKEEAKAEEELAKMEKLDTSSAEFATKFEKLRAAVLAHAEAEEENIFPMLRALARPEVREEMGERYERAKQAAPTHPHPHAPNTPPGNFVVGPIAALFDKARDAVQSI